MIERKVDELGRISLPYDLRSKLNITEKTTEDLNVEILICEKCIDRIKIL